MTPYFPFVVQVVSGEDGEVFRGTGFVVAPGIVLTCKHVLGLAGASLSVRMAPAAPLVSVTRCVASCQARDLALLHVESALGERGAPIFSELSKERWQRLKDCELWAKGGESLEAVSLGQPIQARFAAGTEWIADIQLEGGIKDGFSGCPILVSLGERWVCIGVARLGGEGAATSRFVAADSILDFLRQAEVHGVERVTGFPGKASNRLRWLRKSRFDIRWLVALVVAAFGLCVITAAAVILRRNAQPDPILEAKRNTPRQPGGIGPRKVQPGPILEPDRDPDDDPWKPRFNPDPGQAPADRPNKAQDQDGTVVWRNLTARRLQICFFPKDPQRRDWRMIVLNKGEKKVEDHRRGGLHYVLMREPFATGDPIHIGWYDFLNTEQGVQITIEQDPYLVDPNAVLDIRAIEHFKK